MMIPGLIAVPERMKKILKNAASEIRLLSEKLRTQSGLISENVKSELDTDLVHLPIFIKDLIAQKNLEYSQNNRVRVVNATMDKDPSLYVKVSSLELRSILSNLVNNSFDAYGKNGGVIEVSIRHNSDQCEISVKDFGTGISEAVVANLGKKTISTKEASGRGIGLLHAFKVIEALGGSIAIDTKVGVGTEVKVGVPVYSFNSPKKENLSSKEINL